MLTPILRWKSAPSNLLTGLVQKQEPGQGDPELEMLIKINTILI